MTAETPTDTPTDFTILQGHKYMNLITFRRNGQPVSTPVWMAQAGERLYVTTEMNTGKVKRIRHTSRVQLAPSDRAGKQIGPTVWGNARLLSGTQAEHADTLLGEKYGLMKRLFDLFGKLRSGERVFLEIVPAEGEQVSG